MFSVSELRAMPLFSALADKELEHIARTSADLRLLAGEYAIHEGESRALFVTAEGKLDVTKLVDGVEQKIGVREPWDLFGEVPMTLNTPFLAGMRAAEPSRVLRMEAKDFHTLASAAPDISAVVGASALDRIEGLQEIAAQPPPPELLVVGPQWDTACYSLREFLSGNQVPFDWKMPDDPAVPPSMLERYAQAGRYPIVQLRDGKTLVVDPSPRELAKAIGLSITPKHAHYDVVIVGGGPGGLAAAVYGASEGLRTVLVEREAPGGQAGTSSRIENYLGFPIGISGDELANRALQQARRMGAEIIVTRSTETIDTAAHAVVLDGGQRLTAHAIILAPGVRWRRLTVEGADRFIGSGVYYGAAQSEAASAQGKDIFLIGAGNSAGQAALFFANHAASVTLLVRGHDLAKSMSHYLIEQLKTKSNVHVELRSEVVALYGTDHLEAIDVRNGAHGTTTRRDAAVVFVLIGADAQTSWLPDAIARDPLGYVITGADLLKDGLWAEDRDPYLLETSVPGIFAVGDVRAGSVKRVAASVGEGSMAIAFVHQYLQESRRHTERKKRVGI